MAVLTYPTTASDYAVRLLHQVAGADPACLQVRSQRGYSDELVWMNALMVSLGKTTFHRESLEAFFQNIGWGTTGEIRALLESWLPEDVRAGLGSPVVLSGQRLHYRKIEDEGEFGFFSAISEIWAGRTGTFVVVRCQEVSPEAASDWGWEAASDPGEIQWIASDRKELGLHGFSKSDVEQGLGRLVPVQRVLVRTVNWRAGDSPRP